MEDLRPKAASPRGTPREGCGSLSPQVKTENKKVLLPKQTVYPVCGDMIVVLDRNRNIFKNDYIYCMIYVTSKQLWYLSKFSRLICITGFHFLIIYVLFCAM